MVFIRIIAIYCFYITALNSQYYSDHISDKNFESKMYPNGNKQTAISNIDDDGFFYYREWRLDGTKKIEGRFLNQDGFNYRYGLWISWYKNGQKRSEIYYKYDIEFGECTYYNKNGSIEKKENCGLKKDIQPFYKTEGYSIGNINPANHPPEDGIWKYEGPFITIEVTYFDWKKNGLYNEWTSGNGKLLKHGHYKDDKKYGLWTTYHQNGLDYDNSTGIIYHECFYTEGLRDGITRRYFYSGQIKVEGKLKGNKKVGTWTYYSKDGTIKNIVNCETQDCN